MFIVIIPTVTGVFVILPRKTDNRFTETYYATGPSECNESQWVQRVTVQRVTTPSFAKWRTLSYFRSQCNGAYCSKLGSICNIFRVAKTVGNKNYLTYPNEIWYACSWYQIEIGDKNQPVVMWRYICNTYAGCKVN